MSRFSLTIATVALLLLALSIALVSASKPVGNLPNYNELEDKELDYVPNPDNADDNLELSCHACSLGVAFMKNHLEKLKLEFQRQPQNLKEYHALAAIDGICRKYALNVGLLALSDKEVTKQFVHEADAKEAGGASVLKGGWITRFFMQKCEDMTTEAEERILEMMHGKQVDLCPACTQLNEKNKQPKKKAGKKKSRKGGAKKKKQNADL